MKNYKEIYSTTVEGAVNRAEAIGMALSQSSGDKPIGVGTRKTGKSTEVTFFYEEPVPKKEHTESYQLKQVAERLRLIEFALYNTCIHSTGAKAFPNIKQPSDLYQLSTSLNSQGDFVKRSRTAPSQEDFDKLVKRVEALEPKCTTMDEYIKRTQG